MVIAWVAIMAFVAIKFPYPCPFPCSLASVGMGHSIKEQFTAIPSTIAITFILITSLIEAVNKGLAPKMHQQIPHYHSWY